MDLYSLSTSFLRDSAFYDIFDPLFFVQEYELNDKGIDIGNKRKAAESIYDCLVEIAEEAMCEAAIEAGKDEQWYKEHRLVFRHLVLETVNGVISLKQKYVNERNQKDGFISTFKSDIHRFLNTDEEGK